MAESREFSPYQQKVIRRYYENQPLLARQRLAELVGELFLAEGKKKDRLWKSAGELMARLGLPQARIEHLLRQARPDLLAVVVKELEETR